jgi:hypothetical protein
MVSYMTIDGTTELPIINNWQLSSFLNDPLPSLIRMMLKDKDIKLLILYNITDAQIYWVLSNLIGNVNIQYILFHNIILNPGIFLYINTIISQTVLKDIKAANYSVDLDLPTSKIRQICKKHERMYG